MLVSVFRGEATARGARLSIETSSRRRRRDPSLGRRSRAGDTTDAEGV
jgi:hypothetical protein